MVINEVNVSYRRTIQVRQMEPAVVEVSFSALAEPGDEAPKMAKQMLIQAEEQVNQQIDSIAAAHYDDSAD